MSSNFDPNNFLDATTTQAATRRAPLPAGQDFVATIGEISIRPWQGKTDSSKSGFAADFPLEIDLAAYPAVSIGVPRVTLRGSIMLDTTADGSLDMSSGKNGGLRRYREALGMNKDGEPFSIRAMTGRQVKVKIKHRAYEGETFDEVDSVAKA